MKTNTTKPLLKWSHITPEELVIMEKQMFGVIEEKYIEEDGLDIIKDCPKIIYDLTEFYMDFIEEELFWRENNDWRFNCSFEDYDEFRKSMYMFVGTVHLKLLEKKGLLDRYNRWFSKSKLFQV